jgi:hypothetical protein
MCGELICRRIRRSHRDMRHLDPGSGRGQLSLVELKSHRADARRS